MLTVCRYQYWLPEDINSQLERKTNIQRTLILFFAHAIGEGGCGISL
jgi:hypothetical protein